MFNRLSNTAVYTMCVGSIIGTYHGYLRGKIMTDSIVELNKGNNNDIKSKIKVIIDEIEEENKINKELRSNNDFYSNNILKLYELCEKQLIPPIPPYIYGDNIINTVKCGSIAIGFFMGTFYFISIPALYISMLIKNKKKISNL